jgi:coenzyme F420-reducing hydrogenase delta subunit
MNNEYHHTLALFYCQNVPESSEADRQALEMRYGQQIRFFPIPCSGRLEPVHLLRSLEEFADAAYVITCPESACRYFEGNSRAVKRVERTQKIIASIGLEQDRVGIVMGSKDNPRSLTDLAEEIMEKTSNIDPSPVLKQANG